MKKIQLPDGTHLDVSGDDNAVGVDSQSGRTAHWDAAESVLRDSTGNIIRKVGNARHTAKPQANPAPSKQVASDASRRFATLNTFVDQVMRHLSPVESAVWLALFRDTRHGQASASNRDLARRTGCSVRAVTNAMQELRRFHLIEGLALSKSKGQASLYAVNVRPESCVPELLLRPNQRPSRSGARRASDNDTTTAEPVHAVHRIGG
jgi:hypothetical protein